MAGAAQTGNLRDDRSRDLWVGWNPFKTDKFFAGSIDEVRLYDWALTDDYVRQIYELNAPTVPVVEIPYFLPESGTFTDSVLITVNCLTDSVTIRYTLDGSVPTDSSAVYTEPLLLTETTTLVAKGYRDGYTASEAALAVFTVTAGSSSVADGGIPSEQQPYAIIGRQPGNGLCKIYMGMTGSICVYDADGSRIPADISEPVAGYRSVRIDGPTGTYLFAVERQGMVEMRRYLLIE